MMNYYYDAFSPLWLLLLVFVVLPSPNNITTTTVVSAWGKDGHELIGNLAFKLLSNETQTIVCQILVDHPIMSNTNAVNNNNKNNNINTPLGAVADWADQVRIHHEWHWSGVLHYIDIHDNVVTGGCPVYNETSDQLAQCRFEYQRDCSKNACVAGAIVNYTNHLAEWNQQQQQQQRHHQHHQQYHTTQKHDALSNHHHHLRGSLALTAPWWFTLFGNGMTIWDSKSNNNIDTVTTPTVNQQQEQLPMMPSTLIQESLMFLTHFVGDIHQPLHSARTTDRGGNSIAVTFDKKIVLNSTATTTTTTTSSSSSHHHTSHALELHAVWDSSMIIRAIQSKYNGSRALLEDELLEYIIHTTTQQHQHQQPQHQGGELYLCTHDWLKCTDTSQYDHCTSVWAQESFENAMTWAYANVDNVSEVVSGTHLTDEYYETRWIQIKHYLALAGARLAASLEQTLGPSSAASALSALATTSTS